MPPDGNSPSTPSTALWEASLEALARQPAGPAGSTGADEVPA